MLKPRRPILGRLGGYAGEAAAYLRRRRVAQRPFARVYYADGRSAAFPPDREAAGTLFMAAARLIEAAGRRG